MVILYIMCNVQDCIIFSFIWTYFQCVNNINWVHTKWEFRFSIVTISCLQIRWLLFYYIEIRFFLRKNPQESIKFISFCIFNLPNKIIENMKSLRSISVSGSRFSLCNISSICHALKLYHDFLTRRLSFSYKTSKIFHLFHRFYSKNSYVHFG